MVESLRTALAAATERAERAERDAKAWQATADECEVDKTAISRALVEIKADLTAARALLREVVEVCERGGDGAANNQIARGWYGAANAIRALIAGRGE